MKTEYHHFHIIDSTNSWAKHNASTFPRDKITLITAEEQTSGRGRYNRHWESPPNQNIYASFCFFQPRLDPSMRNISQVMAVAVAQMLEEQGVHPQLKWPNDILLSQRKAGGILCETTPIDDAICIVVGIGLNVNMPPQAIQKIDRPATSLYVETGREFEIQELIRNLETHCVRALKQFLEHGFEPFLPLYLERLAHRQGDMICFHVSQEVWKGTFQSIQADGSLNMVLGSGEIKNFLIGELS